MNNSPASPLPKENKVQIWDLATTREVRSVNLSDKNFDSADMAFTADGHVLVAGIVDKRVKLWDVTSRANERDLGSATQLFGQLKFSRDARLLSFSEGYSVKIWDVASGRELPALLAPNSGLFATTGRVFAGFSDDGKKVATGGFDTPTILWETETAKQLLKLSGRTNTRSRSALTATNFLPEAARVGIYVRVEDYDSPPRQPTNSWAFPARTVAC